MPIITTDDGEQIEVSFGAIQLKDDEQAKEWQPAQELANQTAASVRSNYKDRIKPEDALKDDELWQQMAERRGVELREDGRPKGASTGEVAQLKERIAELEPKASKYEEAQAQIAKARETRLENKLLQHADAVKDDVKDVYLSIAKERFTYDETKDEHVPVGEDGNADYVKDASDVIRQLQTDKPSLFKDLSAQDTGTSADDTPAGSQRTYTAEEFQAKMANAAELSDDEYNELSTAFAEGRVLE